MNNPIKIPANQSQSTTLATNQVTRNTYILFSIILLLGALTAVNF